MKQLFVFLAACLYFPSVTTSISSRHADNLDIIAEDSIISDAHDESIGLGRDEVSGCLCRHYITANYVTCYDPVSCKAFPKDVTFRTHMIRISTTAIKILRKNDLINNSNLTTFRIEGNEFLQTIQPGAFNGMTNLRNLTITHNKNLLTLENGTFDGLTNLILLKLNNNGFPTLKSFTNTLTTHSLPNLQRLIIAQMLFPNIDSDDFNALQNTTIESLNLYTCKIEYIHPHSLSNFKNLKILGLGENNLNSSNIVEILDMTINQNIPLEYISLLGVGFKELPMEVLNVIAKTNITHLSLSRNPLEKIETFPSMPNIQRLDLTEVTALDVEPHAFKSLPNLRSLYLDRNKLSDIPQAVLLSNLTFLDISYMSTKYVTPKHDVFENMSQLIHLNLSGNNLRKLSEYTFVGLTKLKVLGLKESQVFYIDNSTFMPLKNLLFLDLQKNMFPQRMNLTESIFDGLQNLQVLLLGHCKIDHIGVHDPDVFAKLKSLKHLGLQGNDLKSIPASIFKHLEKLEVLDISMNMFLSWDSTMLVYNVNLRRVVAYGNKIRNITKAMIEDFKGLHLLDLHNNPFGCTCDDLKALSDIIYREKYEVVFDLLHQHQLNCTYPEVESNQTILDFLDNINKTRLCEIEDAEIAVMLIAVPFVVVLVMVIIVTVVSFIYRWHIRYWFFLTKLYLNRSGKSMMKPKSDASFYEYDAFVSYSNEDQNFVVRLVTMLENHAPFLKLCVYERDFQIGTVISESVLESVGKSRKTLLIVSESYIKSQWCRWEVQVAENHRLFFENEHGECVNDSIIIIKLGEVSTANISPMLRYLMKTRIYLQWDGSEKKQKVFWNKLRETLSPPKTVCSMTAINL